MDCNKTMAKPDGDLTREISFVLDPIARIVDRLPDVNRDAIGLNADVAGRRAVLPRPAPHLAKMRRCNSLRNSWPRTSRLFAVDLEDGDRDHQVAGKLEGVGLNK